MFTLVDNKIMCGDFEVDEVSRTRAGYHYDGYIYRTKKLLLENVRLDRFIWRVFQTISERYSLSMGDLRCYSPEERTEEYVENALVLITYEGSEWYTVFNPYYAPEGTLQFYHKVYEEFRQELEKHNLFMEFGTHWYGGIYKIK